MMTHTTAVIPDAAVVLPPLATTCAIPRRPLTEAQLCDWIADARVGEAIQYLSFAVRPQRGSSPLPTQERIRLHAVARRAWIACELGLVHLFSAKVGEGRYRYLALRSANPLMSATADAAATGAVSAAATLTH